MHDHQAIWIGKRQWPDGDRVDEGEDGDVGADPEGKHQHRDRGERGLLPENAKRLQEILSNGCHDRASGLQMRPFVTRRKHVRDEDADDLSPVPDPLRQCGVVTGATLVQGLLEIAADNLGVLGTHAPAQERFGESRRFLWAGRHAYPFAVLSRVARPLAIWRTDS